jgi:hypothetical protein
MDNYGRRLAYAQQRYGDTADTLEMLNASIRDGAEDRMLTPAQRRRVRHKRGSAHRPVIRYKTSQPVQTARGKNPQVVFTDEARGFITPEDLVPDGLRKMAVVVDGTRISDLVPVLGLRQDEHGIVKT